MEEYLQAKLKETVIQNQHICSTCLNVYKSKHQCTQHKIFKHFLSKFDVSKETRPRLPEFMISIVKKENSPMLKDFLVSFTKFYVQKNVWDQTGKIKHIHREKIRRTMTKRLRFESDLNNVLLENGSINLCIQNSGLTTKRIWEGVNPGLVSLEIDDHNVKVLKCRGCKAYFADKDEFDYRHMCHLCHLKKLALELNLFQQQKLKPQISEFLSQKFQQIECVRCGKKAKNIEEACKKFNSSHIYENKNQEVGNYFYRKFKRKCKECINRQRRKRYNNK